MTERQAARRRLLAASWEPPAAAEETFGPLGSDEDGRGLNRPVVSPLAGHGHPNARRQVLQRPLNHHLNGRIHPQRGRERAL